MTLDDRKALRVVKSRSSARVAAVYTSILCAWNFIYISYNLKTGFPKMWPLKQCCEHRNSSGVKEV